MWLAWNFPRPYIRSILHFSPPNVLAWRTFRFRASVTHGFCGFPMALAHEDLKIRAKQVGMLMRAYRENFPLGDDKSGLTLEELLARMAMVNRRYENSVGSTVAVGIRRNHALPETAPLTKRTSSSSQTERSGLPCSYSWALPL